MTGSVFKVSFIEADTGIVLNEDGSRWIEEDGIEKFEPTFDCLDKAEALKGELLASKPNGEVLIERDGESPKVYRDESRLSEFLLERKEMFRWLSLPTWIRVFKRKPRCENYKGE